MCAGGSNARGSHPTRFERSQPASGQTDLSMAHTVRSMPARVPCPADHGSTFVFRSATGSEASDIAGDPQA